MMTNIHCGKCIGIDAVPVTIEIDINPGIGIHLVGLADIAVKESLLRTVTALQSLGFKIPGKKIVINLAPADLQKNGSGYDLPIALGIIAASGQLCLPGIDKYLIMGELGLDGSVRPVPGAIPLVELAIKENLSGSLLPASSALEAAEYVQSKVFGVDSLKDAIRILQDADDCSDLLVWNRKDCKALSDEGCGKVNDFMDFSEIIGQEGAKRGLEIAAAGAHNVIMVGPPGSGKSSLAKALAGILPPMSLEESILTSKIYSVAGKGDIRYGLIKQRPFRSPHYSASLAAMIGGGNGGNIIPGEVSLSQNGILFLDEFCEIRKTVAEALRGPLEDRKVSISRLRSKIEYPASFMLVAASNPCPCGYYGEGDRCVCTVGQRSAYLAKLSGPIMDRIDIHLWMHSVDPSRLVRVPKGEPSSAVAARVKEARDMQIERFRGEEIFTNAEMNNRLIREYCPLSGKCKDLMTKVISSKGLSARAFSRILKLSRTIADLAGDDQIGVRHISEAAGLRFLDRMEM